MEKNIVILLRQDGLGQVGLEDHQFGYDMLERFFHTLEGQSPKPRAILFYTSAVKVLCQGSPLLTGLSLLEGLGVRLLACKTCLEHYKLLDKVAVGKVGGMNDIVKVMLEADQVITI